MISRYVENMDKQAVNKGLPNHSGSPSRIPICFYRVRP